MLMLNSSKWIKTKNIAYNYCKYIIIMKNRKIDMIPSEVGNNDF